MPFLSFFIATGIGQLPATIVYSYVGGMLTGGARFFVTGLLILFALSAFVAMVDVYKRQGERRWAYRAGFNDGYRVGFEDGRRNWRPCNR